MMKSCLLWLNLFADSLRFLILGLRSKSSLAAENLFLREQLAFYKERRIKPRRTSYPARLRLRELEQWGPDNAGLRLLIASICHHGRAVEVGQGYAPRDWRRARGLDPFAGIAKLGALTRN